MTSDRASNQRTNKPAFYFFPHGKFGCKLARPRVIIKCFRINLPSVFIGFPFTVPGCNTRYQICKIFLKRISDGQYPIFEIFKQNCGTHPCPAIFFSILQPSDKADNGVGKEGSELCIIGWSPGKVPVPSCKAGTIPYQNQDQNRYLDVVLHSALDVF